MSKALTPPDLERCQAEMSNGVNAFTLGGRREMVRCSAKPTVLVKEKKPGEDGLLGSMTLCTSCLIQFMMQKCPTPDEFEFEELK